MAMLADKLRDVAATPAPRSARGRQLLPDAHRRRASHRQRAGVRTMHLAEILAVDRSGDRPEQPLMSPRSADVRPGRRPSRGAARGGPGRHAAPPQHAQGDPDDPRQARRASSPSCPTGRSSARPGRAIKDARSAHLDSYLLAAGGVGRPRPAARSTGPRDAAEANRIVTGLVQATGADEVVKVKSMTTDEIGLNEALAAAGHRTRIETDLAELIVQLAGDRPSHILVPAIHKNRSEIRDLFQPRAEGRPSLTDEPTTALADAAAPPHLREKFLRRQGRRQRGELRRRRDRHRLRRRVRGQRADVPDPARDADHRHGDREVLPALAGPRGLPAAAARAPPPASG